MGDLFDRWHGFTRGYWLLTFKGGGLVEGTEARGWLGGNRGDEGRGDAPSLSHVRR